MKLTLGLYVNNTDLFILFLDVFRKSVVCGKQCGELRNGPQGARGSESK